MLRYLPVQPLRLTSEADEKVKDARSTVRKFEKTYLIEATDGQRYVPKNLPKQYRQVGTLVKFSGILLPLPEGVKAIGRPIKLTEVRLIDEL